MTYRVGPGDAAVHFSVESDWSLKTIYDVIAMLKGSTYPDQWMVRGNHHDGWVFGASDPLSGQVALLEEAKAMGALLRRAGSPSALLFMAVGTRKSRGFWARPNGPRRMRRSSSRRLCSISIRDSNGRGFFGAGGNHDFQHFVNEGGGRCDRPRNQGDCWRAPPRQAAHRCAGAGRQEDDVKERAKIAADPKKDFPIDALGSGSDYSTFLEHLGVPALNIEFGEEGNSGGVYHSRYDTFEHHSKFVDPGFVYGALLTKTIGRMILRAADSDLPLQQAGDFADTMAVYLGEVKKLAKDKREEAATQAKLLADHVFELSADPTKTSGVPTALQQVPQMKFAALEAAVARLKKSAKAYDDAFAQKSSHLSANSRARLLALMQTIDQTLAPDVGLPGRDWYKNLIYAPGRFTGYGAKPLPGVREGIEDQRLADAERYDTLTANALNAYSSRLDQATAVLNGH